jgi:putative ABC transport system ATP-binding protein
VALMMAMHREAGTTLLLITHDKGLAEQCDRVVTIRDGKML